MGRKELVIRLANRGQDLVFRIDPDITAIVPDTKGEAILSELLAEQPYLGEVMKSSNGVWGLFERDSHRLLAGLDPGDDRGCHGLPLLRP